MTEPRASRDIKWTLVAAIALTLGGLGALVSAVGNGGTSALLVSIGMLLIGVMFFVIVIVGRR